MMIQIKNIESISDYYYQRALGKDIKYDLDKKNLYGLPKFNNDTIIKQLNVEEEYQLDEPLKYATIWINGIDYEYHFYSEDLRDLFAFTYNTAVNGDPRITIKIQPGETAESEAFALYCFLYVLTAHRRPSYLLVDYLYLDKTRSSRIAKIYKEVVKCAETQAKPDLFNMIDIMSAIRDNAKVCSDDFCPITE